MAAARWYDLLEDPDVLTAARWQDWLHPRGIDGRFIEKGGMVDVFGKPSGERALLDPRANRRRAKIKNLFPEGAILEYFDHDGNPMPADPANGYPTKIDLKDISKKISSAPNSRARLFGVSSKTEYDAGLVPAQTQDEYDQAVSAFNQRVADEFRPERSAAHKNASLLTKNEFSQHLDFVTEVVDAGLAAQPGSDKGLGSESAFKDSYGRWSQDQLERMLTMSADLYDQVTAGRVQGHKAIVLGGLPGSGKSTLLSQLDEAGTIKRDQWVEINPDLVKEEMFKRGWYPQVDGLTPAETSSFIHAQSGEMASMLERLAMKDGYNLIFDVTMGSGGTEGKTWTDHTLDQLAFYGYDKPDGMFISSTIQHSLASIQFRHQDGLNQYRTGAPTQGREIGPEVTNGGRFVPASAVAEDLSGVNVNEQNFERLKAKFDRWAQYEVANDPGTKPAPELVDSTPELPNFPATATGGM